MRPVYKAVIQRDGQWWIGWLQEIPGVYGQGRKELLDNWRSALQAALETNWADAAGCDHGGVRRSEYRIVKCLWLTADYANDRPHIHTRRGWRDR